MNELSIHDKVAMYVGGGLVILGTVVIGILEMIGGAGHPVDAEGQIVHEALVPIEIRSYIIMAGLIVWGLYAIYKVVGTTPRGADTSTGTAKPGGAD